MIDTQAVGGAFAVTSIAGASRLMIQGVTAGTQGSTSDIFTSMGVFAAALAIAYFMLRRGDKREADMLNAAAEELKTIRNDLQASRLHAEQVGDKLVTALVHVAELEARLKASEEDQ